MPKTGVSVFAHTVKESMVAADSHRQKLCCEHLHGIAAMRMVSFQQKAAPGKGVIDRASDALRIHQILRKFLFKFSTVVDKSQENTCLLQAHV